MQRFHQRLAKRGHWWLQPGIPLGCSDHARPAQSSSLVIAALRPERGDGMSPRVERSATRGSERLYSFCPGRGRGAHYERLRDCLFPQSAGNMPPHSPADRKRLFLAVDGHIDRIFTDDVAAHGGADARKKLPHRGIITLSFEQHIAIMLILHPAGDRQCARERGTRRAETHALHSAAVFDADTLHSEIVMRGKQSGCKWKWSGE